MYDKLMVSFFLTVVKESWKDFLCSINILGEIKTKIFQVFPFMK